MTAKHFGHSCFTNRSSHAHSSWTRESAWRDEDGNRAATRLVFWNYITPFPSTLTTPSTEVKQKINWTFLFQILHGLRPFPTLETLSDGFSLLPRMIALKIRRYNSQITGYVQSLRKKLLDQSIHYYSRIHSYSYVFNGLIKLSETGATYEVQYFATSLQKGCYSIVWNTIV